jgi:hypothetical protein
MNKIKLQKIASYNVADFCVMCKFQIFAAEKETSGQQKELTRTTQKDFFMFL